MTLPLTCRQPAILSTAFGSFDLKSAFRHLPICRQTFVVTLFAGILIDFENALARSIFLSA
jgi:hypothetical protein